MRVTCPECGDVCDIGQEGHWVDYPGEYGHCPLCSFKQRDRWAHRYLIWPLLLLGVAGVLAVPVVLIVRYCLCYWG